MVKMRNTLSMISMKYHLTDIHRFLLWSMRCHYRVITHLYVKNTKQPENQYITICNNQQLRTKLKDKIWCSKNYNIFKNRKKSSPVYITIGSAVDWVLIIYNDRKSVYCNMQQSVVQIADFRRSQAGAEIRTALIAVGATCLCDLSRNESNQTWLCICNIRIFVRSLTNS